MKISEAFPSNFLRAQDLNGRTDKKVIAGVELQDVAGQGNKNDYKPVASFTDKSKPLVLNKTNSAILAETLGDETGGWAGKEIELFCSQTQFQGRLVPCIRVRVAGGNGETFDDDIKF